MSGERTRGACAPRKSDRFEGELQIVDQIANVFDAHRKAHERIGHAERFALFFRYRRMRHEGGMINQALDAAQTFRERKKMRVLKETPCALEIGFQNHRDHAAETAHLGAGEVVLWMRLEPGI